MRLAALLLDYRARIDWQTFWVREIIILFVPWPIAVLTVPKSSYIRPAGVAVLLAILLGLTLWNLIWALFRSSPSDRARI
jgi:hypothetical protein